MLVFGNVAPSVKCILFWSTSGMNGFVLIHRRNLYLMHPVKDKRPQTQEEFVAVFVASSLWSPKSYPTKNRVYTYKGLAIPPASPSGRISIINASCMLCAMLSLSKAKKIVWCFHSLWILASFSYHPPLWIYNHQSSLLHSASDRGIHLLGKQKIPKFFLEKRKNPHFVFFLVKAAVFSQTSANFFRHFFGDFEDVPLNISQLADRQGHPIVPVRVPQTIVVFQTLKMYLLRSRAC